eukprot:7650734-Pyramimonas_sp.AAC.1
MALFRNDITAVISRSGSVANNFHKHNIFERGRLEKEQLEQRAKEKQAATGELHRLKHFNTLNEQISYMRSGEYDKVDTPAHVLMSIWSWFNNRAGVRSHIIMPYTLSLVETVSPS